MTAHIERIREDRLLRWGAYLSIPYVWLALALLNPLLLVVPPIFVFALRKAFAYGIVERYEPPPDPDLL